MTQQKFISQLVIQDETCIHNFDSESEQQSMQCSERIGQKCRFITLLNSVFYVECKQPTTAKMHKIFIAQKSYRVCHVRSLATIRSKYYCNFILNRTRSGGELFDRPSYIATVGVKGFRSLSTFSGFNIIKLNVKLMMSLITVFCTHEPFIRHCCATVEISRLIGCSDTVVLSSHSAV